MSSIKIEDSPVAKSRHRLMLRSESSLQGNEEIKPFVLSDISRKIAALKRGQKILIAYMQDKFGLTMEEAYLKAFAMVNSQKEERNARLKRRKQARKAKEQARKAKEQKRIAKEQARVLVTSRNRRVGLVGVDWPFGKEEALKVKEAIIEVLIDHPPNCRPEFNGVTCQNGLFIASVVGDKSVSWLSKHVKAISEAAGFAIKMVGEGRIPPAMVHKGVFKDSANLDKNMILSNIGCGGLKWFDTEQWIVTRREQTNQDVLLTLEIDDASAEIIKYRKGILAYRGGYALIHALEPKA